MSQPDDSPITDTDLLNYFESAYLVKTAHEQGIKAIPGMQMRLNLSLELLGYRADGASLRDCLLKIRAASLQEIVTLKLESD